MKGTDLAPEGQTWVCCACGKTARSRYGFDAEGNRTTRQRWDESCAMNAELFSNTRLVFGDSGLVVDIKKTEATANVG